jgi:uncharacterized membrane protein
MSEKRDLKLDRIVAQALKLGAYLGFVVLAVALLATFVTPQYAALLAKIGVIVMISTPPFRLAIALIVFLYERDYRYAAITSGVLLILLLSAVFGIGEH